MKKLEIEQYRLDHKLKLVFFVGGLFVAFILAIFDSPHTTAAFTFVGGLLGGTALDK